MLQAQRVYHGMKTTLTSSPHLLLPPSHLARSKNMTGPLTVNLDTFLADPTSPAALEEARKTAESLITTGALVVKDSRAAAEANDRFLDLFEDYFALDEQVLVKDERPELGYQVVSHAY